MALSKKSLATVATIGSLLVLILAAVILWDYRLNKRVQAYQLITEGNPSDEQLLNFLKSNDQIILENTLRLLEHRKVLAGREPGIKLLTNPDLYIWYPASLYLGALGDQRSVPYLIRGLDHPAWRSRPRVVAYLKVLTGQDFGERKQDWISWWSAKQPQSAFDFTCVKPPQVAAPSHQ